VAYFQPLPPPPDTFNLTLISVPFEGGQTFTSGRYVENSEVQIYAPANPGFKFVNWTDGNNRNISSFATSTIKLTKDSTLYANFVDISNRILILSCKPDETADLYGSGPYQNDAIVTIEAIVKDPICYGFYN